MVKFALIVVFFIFISMILPLLTLQIFSVRSLVNKFYRFFIVYRQLYLVKINLRKYKNDNCTLSVDGTRLQP